MDSLSTMSFNLSAVVGQLASLYGFDSEDAMKKLTENNTSNDDNIKKIAECEKNISLWEKKLADGKVTDAAKHVTKIEKEKAKLAKLKTPTAEKKVSIDTEKVEEKKAPEGVEKKPKATKKKAPEEKSEVVEKKAPEGADKEKRIKRFSPVMTSQLKTALQGVGLDVNDKLKKEFQNYIEDLTDDDYRANGLAEHMRAFAKLKAPEMRPEVEEPAKETDKPVEKEQSSNAAGGGPKIHTLNLGDLQSIKFTATVDPTGPLWDADNGRFVQGPSADDDEDVGEVEFNGKTYAVGEKTGRVYEARDTGDVFAGWCGVGAFKDMKMA